MVFTDEYHADLYVDETDGRAALFEHHYVIFGVISLVTIFVGE